MSRPLEAAVIQRRQQRAETALRRKNELETLKNQGNELFKKGDYKGAANVYITGVEKYGRKPVLLSNLAVTLSKLQLWEAVEYVSTLVLQADPQNLKARFRRAAARDKLKLRVAAMNDYGIVMDEEDRAHPTGARSEYLRLERMMDGEYFNYQPTRMEEWDDECVWPNYEAQPDDYQSDSDTEDSRHVGKGFPCRFYNHGGCRKGTTCAFSHSRDTKSARDELGKNVCLNFLLGQCQFDDAKCAYSHDKSYLPPPSWWEDCIQADQTKELLDYVSNPTGKMARYHDVIRGLPGRQGVEVEREVVLSHLRQINQLAGNQTTIPQIKPSSTAPPAKMPEITTPIAFKPRSEQHILVVSVGHQSFHDEMYRDLHLALKSKHTVVHVTDTQKAFDALSSPESILAVLVADGDIAEKRNRARGGVVVMGACTSSGLTASGFEALFQAFGLSWTRGSYHREDFSTNSTNEVAQRNPSLPRAYSMKALQVSGVTKEIALYVSDEEHHFSGESPVVMAKVGQGYLGYIGDVNAEADSTTVTLAMLGILDAPHPQAPVSSNSTEASNPTPTRSSNRRRRPGGSRAARSTSNSGASTPASSSGTVHRTGVAQVVAGPSGGPVNQPGRLSPPVTSVERTGYARVLPGPADITNSSTTPAPSRSPAPSLSPRKTLAVLTLVPSSHGLVVHMHQNQLDRFIDTGVKIELVKSGSQMLRLLGSTSDRAGMIGVYVADEGIVHPANASVLAALVKYIKEDGGTVVISGIFPGQVTPMELSSTFAAFGLKWQMGDYRRRDFQPQPTCELERNGSLLPAAYSMKAVSLNKIEFDEACYVLYDPEDPFYYRRTDRELEAPVAQSRVGKGIVGYIGDVNSEDETADVILAMFGQLVPPVPPVRKARPFAIMLSLEDDEVEWYGKRFAPLLAYLRKHIEVIHDVSMERMTDLIDSPDFLGAMVPSTNLLEPDKGYILSKLVDRCKIDGATILFMESFARLVTIVECRPFFIEHFSLEWKVASSSSDTAGGVYLNQKNELFSATRSGTGKMPLPKMLDVANCHSASFTDPSHAVYVPKKAARDPRGVTVQGRWMPEQGRYIAPMLYAKVGDGHVGFVGGCDDATEGHELVLSMLTGGYEKP